MPTNPYFAQYESRKIEEQILVDDLLEEVIQIFGHDCSYLPRESWEEVDRLYGENINSKFERAYKMEMYIGETKGFTGDQDFFSKFGLEIRDNSYFTVTRRTFDRYVPSNIIPRPREGDLIWVPVMNRIFEIKFVEEESPQFFALGNKHPYVYELRCELFRYSNEEINTGIREIDNIELESGHTIQLILSGSGNYFFGEKVFQGSNLEFSTFTADVSGWDGANNALNLVNITGQIVSGNNIIGERSGASLVVTSVDELGDFIYYDTTDNKLVQEEGNVFVSYLEQNPFGSV